MTIIRKDEKGLYALVGGYVVRPAATTNFQKGDKTEGKHFGGCTLVGMGKLPGRGNYKEHWITMETA